MNIDRFLEIEKKYNLYSIDVNGINFWIYFRQKLWNFQICAQKLEMTSATKIDRSISVFIRRCRYYLNTKIYKNIDILFLNHSRRIKSGRYYDCMYTEEISSRYSSTGTLEDAFQQVHFAPNRTANLMFTDNIWINSVAYTKLFKIFSKRKYNEFYKKIKEQIEPAIKEIESFYSWEADIDKIVLECLNIVLRVTYARGKYFKVLKKINPKMIVEVVNYSFSRMIVNEYAHMYGIPVVELQHGIIYSEHAAYNFASGFDIKQYPDKIFLYSDFWKDQMRPPIPEKNLISVGFPFFEKSIKKYSNIKRDDNRITILFISQWTIGEQLSELAVELSNALPKDGYRIIYKLHPSEYGDWKEKYKKLDESNVEVIHDNEYSIYKYFAESDIQIGVYSTAIYEGLGFDLLTLIMMIGHYDTMEPLVNAGYAQYFDSCDDVLDVLKHYDKDKKTNAVFPLWKTNALNNITEEINKVLISSEGNADED